MTENGAFARYLRMVQHGHSGKGAATRTTTNVHLPRAAASARTACLGLSPGAPSHQGGEQEPLGEQQPWLSPAAQLTHRPASSKPCSPRVLELSSMQERREGRDQHPPQEQGRARSCVLPWIASMRCRQTGSAALTQPHQHPGSQHLGTHASPWIWKPESHSPSPGYGSAEHPLLCTGTMSGEQWNAEGQHVALSLSTAFHTEPGGMAPHIPRRGAGALKLQRGEMCCALTCPGEQE